MRFLLLIEGVAFRAPPVYSYCITVLEATSDMMEPAWESKKESPRRSLNGSNNQKQKINVEPASSSSSAPTPPVLQMPPKKFYNYDRYYEQSPSLFLVMLKCCLENVNLTLLRNREVNHWATVLCRKIQIRTWHRQDQLRLPIDANGVDVDRCLKLMQIDATSTLTTTTMPKGMLTRVATTNLQFRNIFQNRVRKNMFFYSYFLENVSKFPNFAEFYWKLGWF